MQESEQQGEPEKQAKGDQSPSKKKRARDEKGEAVADQEQEQEQQEAGATEGEGAGGSKKAKVDAGAAANGGSGGIERHAVRLEGLPEDATVEEVQAFLGPELSVAAEAIRIGDSKGYVWRAVGKSFGGCCWLGRSIDFFVTMLTASVSFLLPPPMSSRGEAVVELSTAEEVSKALGKDQEKLREQAIGVTKMAATGSEQGQEGGQGQGGGAGQGALRMRGLPYSATKDDIVVRVYDQLG